MTDPPTLSYPTFWYDCSNHVQTELIKKYFQMEIWSFRFLGDFRPFYIFVITGLEPKLFAFKCFLQKQSC